MAQFSDIEINGMTMSHASEPDDFGINISKVNAEQLLEWLEAQMAPLNDIGVNQAPMISTSTQEDVNLCISKMSAQQLTEWLPSAWPYIIDDESNSFRNTSHSSTDASGNLDVSARCPRDCAMYARCRSHGANAAS